MSMNSKLILLPGMLFFLLLLSCSQGTNEADGAVWPPIAPYETGFVRVSEVHELYYELVGNPDGKPVIVLHGGPGGSCHPAMRQLFNPEKFKVLLFDQRGAGRSKPRAELVGNTTRELVSDMETLRVRAGMEKMMIVGGSWGSTLALAYAQQHPERVTDLVLRGIFTGTDEEIDHFYHGGTAGVFPDAYQEFLSALPDPGRRPLPSYLVELLTGSDMVLRKRIADAWLRYEWRISEVAVDTAVISRWTAENDSYAFSLIENHYMANRCFLEPDQLWNNMHTIKHIPLTIVHGRFDMPCQMAIAFRLHGEVPGSTLAIVEEAGHGGALITEALTQAVKNHEPE